MWWEQAQLDLVGADEPVLTIGPRWVGEIHYFRERLALKGTIGLDLFSRDEDLIVHSGHGRSHHQSGVGPAPNHAAGDH